MTVSSYTRQEVVDILNAALARVTRDEDRTLRAQIARLAAFMQGLRHELAQIRPAGALPHNPFPAAADELDTVIAETAAATGAIMDACERLQRYDGLSDEDLKKSIDTETVSIFEACSFQDITSQRITKVVRALKIVENSLSDLLSTTSAETEKTGDDRLLNGPQLQGHGVSQEDIDKILARFD